MKHRKTKHMDHVRITTAGHTKAKKTVNQFKQLISKTPRFVRETSRPAVRTARMRSNT